MSRSASELRLFVAVYPPEAVVRALQRALARLTLPDHRVVPADQVHLTVHFVGGVPVRELDQVRVTLEHAARGIGPFTLAPNRLITLPERSRKRLVAAEADAPPPLAELHRRLVSRLAQRPRPTRPYHPHFTLCRFRREVAMAPLDVPVDAGAFDVGEVALMKSTLSAQGARHDRIGAVELGR